MLFLWMKPLQDKICGLLSPDKKHLPLNPFVGIFPPNRRRENFSLIAVYILCHSRIFLKGSEVENFKNISYEFYITYNDPKRSWKSGLSIPVVAICYSIIKTKNVRKAGRFK